MDIEWTNFSSDMVGSTATFVHWPYRAARWIGDFDRETGTYKSKNESAVSGLGRVGLLDWRVNNGKLGVARALSTMWARRSICLAGEGDTVVLQLGGGAPEERTGEPETFFLASL